MSRRALDERVLEWITAGALAPPDEDRFNALALELAAYQHEHNAAYRRLCAATGCRPDRAARWQEIPTVATGAFKRARLATFPPEATVRVFRTSGTTTQERGTLELDTLEIYDASLLASFGALVCPDIERIRFVVLAPSAQDSPGSSLSYMFERVVERFGTPESRFAVKADGWEPQLVIDELTGLREPVAVVGTSLAFVHLLDAMARSGVALELPPESRIMETGGFKGVSRELTREELHGAIERRLGVPAERIVNQYGMCELGSQFYEPTLVQSLPTRLKHVPPWVRTRVVDPETLEALPPGETGLLIHYDLANTGSALAVQTSDLGRADEGGIEVIGRAPGAEARGCSIAADQLLER